VDFLTVRNTNITDLTGLGQAHIDVMSIDQNPELENLVGLSADNHEPSELSLFGNPKLRRLTGLEGLEAVHRSLSMVENPLLESLEGLENLRSVEHFNLSRAPVLTSLLPLENLQSIAGVATFEGNSALSTCEIQELAARCDPAVSSISDNGPCN
jgi:hypothetical protein